MTKVSQDERNLLRHLLATLAYRGGKCLQGAPATFAHHDTGNDWTPLRILAHMGDLFDWALSMATGEGVWKAAMPETWDQETARFHQGLARLDAFLASGADSQVDLTGLLQGPLADAMTHVGQLAMLRRMVGAPLAGENYFKAKILAGRVGPDQAYPPMRTNR